MFGFLKRGSGASKKKITKAKTRSRSSKPATVSLQHAVHQPEINDPYYDIIKKISDLQDQISRHDSRIHDKIEGHHNFMQSQHHEPMKKAAIEIMNKLYTQPAPIREEVVKMIKTDERIVSIIGDSKMSAGQIAEQIGVTREHVSRRISNLTKAGLLTRINDGRYVFYTKAEQE